MIIYFLYINTISFENSIEITIINFIYSYYHRSRQNRNINNVIKIHSIIPPVRQHEINENFVHTLLVIVILGKLIFPVKRNSSKNKLIKKPQIKIL